MVGPNSVLLLLITLHVLPGRQKVNIQGKNGKRCLFFGGELNILDEKCLRLGTLN